MAIAPSHGGPRHVSLEEFRAEFSADVEGLPRSVCVLGWSSSRARWLEHGFWPVPGGHGRERIDPLVRFFDRHVRPHLPPRSIWFFLHHFDGWREGAPYASNYRWVSGRIGAVDARELGPGEIPVVSRSRRWVACYGAHHRDPSALLLPEPHFLSGRYYGPLFARLQLERCPWRVKRQRCIFAGSDHGNEDPDLRPRRRLRAAAEAGGLPVDVHIGRGVSRRRQMRYRQILDVDGSVRTWTAWAWKLASGSVVLSPGSHWTTFFTEPFVPWEHFVPVEGDFSDLADRLSWCRDNDGECRAIARRARERVEEVYNPAWAGAKVAAALRGVLG